MSLSNEQYNQIMSVYEERQYLHRRETEKRRQKLYARFPRVMAIEAEIRQLAIEEVAERLGGRDGASRAVPGPDALGRQGSSGGAGMPRSAGRAERLERIEALRREKEQLVEASGYTEVPFVCPDCEDTGYVDGRRCHCFDQLVLDRFGDSHTDQAAGLTLEDFSLEPYPAEYMDEQTGRSSLELAKAARARAKDFVAQFGTAFENILLIGKTGTGKTHLSACIGGELLAAGRTVCYLTAFELFATLKKEAFSRGEAQSEDYTRLFSCELLIIDDLGTEFITTMTNSQLFELVNERIRRRRATLISNNLELSELGEVYTERMISRFVEYYTTLKLVGPDIRILKRSKGFGRA
ncbi:MAG: ATP-binding protein [Lachnospiraceae bacterium]|nr:ATP-binding protein [Lachnospiraceae bacterium]